VKSVRELMTGELMCTPKLVKHSAFFVEVHLLSFRIRRSCGENTVQN